MPKKLFDTQDLVIQIDVVRKHLRHLYLMNGPVPVDLSPTHDVMYEALEAERLDQAAKDAEDHAAAMVEVEKQAASRPPDAPLGPSPAELAAQRAASLRQTAEEAKARASSVSTGEIGDSPYRGPSRAPKFPS